MSELSLKFDEQMKGFVTRDVTNDCETGFRLGRKQDERCNVSLTISMPNMKAFVSDPQSLGEVAGQVDCSLLGGRCSIEKGQFNLLTDVVEGLQHFKDIRYRLLIRDPEGHALTFYGTKFVDDNGIFYIWRDTTKLFTKIYKGKVEQGQEENAELVALGILHVKLLDFVKTLGSFDCNPPDFRSRITGKWLYFSLFAKRLWQVYGPRFR